MSPSHLQPRTAGEILDAAFVLYRRHFAVLVAASLLLQLPTAAYWITAAASGEVPAAAPAGVSLYDTLATMLLWGALAGLFSASLTGGDTSAGAAFRRARDCFWRLFGVSVLSGLATLLGIVLLVVPGIAAFLLFFLCSHVVVIEDAGVTRALERSWELSKPHWRRLAGVVVVVGIIAALPFLLAGAAEGLLGSGDPWTAGSARLLELLLLALIYPLAGAAATLLYYDFRVRSEGLDLVAATEEMAVPA